MQQLLKGWALFALLSTQALAATVFDVEVVVVARQDTSDETWPPRPLPQGNTSSLLLDAIKAQCPAPCTSLPALVSGPSQDDTVLPRLLTQGELNFNGAANQLRRLPGGRVLLHTGWRLAPKQPRYATPMAVEAGRDLGGYALSEPVPQGESLDVVIADTTMEDSQPLDEAAPALVSLPELSGQIQVALDHYLLVDMALDLKTVQGEGQPLLVKTLRQKRRLRSGEWHYFDHPALGVLMQIRPVR